MRMGECMKGSGLAILGMEKDLRSLLMVQHTREGTSMANPKGMEDISGKMDKSMKASGKMA